MPVTLAGLSLAFVLGLVFGSFATLLGHRLPRRLPIGAVRSRCPRCLGALPPIAMIPILSYLLQRGRCRLCHAPISARYPLTEALCGLGFGIDYVVFRWTLPFWPVAILIITLVAALAAWYERKEG